MIKKCYMCNREKTLDLFYKNKSKKDGLSAECKECGNILTNKFYKNNKEKCHKINKKSRKNNINKLQNFIFDYLKNKKCLDCGNNNILVLQFDHRNNKTGNVADLVR